MAVFNDVSNWFEIDKEVQVEFDQFFLKNASGMSRMPRADVARYMLDCIPRSEECQRAVAIGV